MYKLYSMVGTKALGLSSAVVLPVAMLIALVTAIAGLVLGIDQRKAKNGSLTRSKSSRLSTHHS